MRKYFDENFCLEKKKMEIVWKVHQEAFSSRFVGITKVLTIKVQRCSASGTNYTFPDVCSCQLRVVRLLFPNLSWIHSHTKGSKQNSSYSQGEIRAIVPEAFFHLITACAVFGREMHMAHTVQSLPSSGESESAFLVLWILIHKGRMGRMVFVA